MNRFPKEVSFMAEDIGMEGDDEASDIAPDENEYRLVQTELVKGSKEKLLVDDFLELSNESCDDSQIYSDEMEVDDEEEEEEKEVKQEIEGNTLDEILLGRLSITVLNEENLGNVSDLEMEQISPEVLATMSNLRPFPDKPYYWMNDYATLQFIRDNFQTGTYYVMHNGKIIENFEDFISKYIGQHLVKFSFHLRLCAGKGGFGSLLRSFRVNKSTNKLMMRDLNGRRLASIDEEKKLKQFLEKQARRVEEARQKRAAKLAKLTAGPPKHQFEDQEYLSRKEEIIEKTEDACEAGFALLKKKKNEKNGDNEESENDDDDNVDVNDLFNERGGRKRKIEGPSMIEESKSRRIDYENRESVESSEDDSENDSENEPDEEELEAIREYFRLKEEEKKLEEKPEEKPENQIKSREQNDSASNVDDLPKIDEKTPCVFAPVNLEDYQNSEELELLGLEHLKSALIDRGLKCGGSLSERAARLWMIKGIENEKEWPRNILTPEKRKKIVDEEEAEKKAAKKAKKKAKKN